MKNFENEIKVNGFYSALGEIIKLHEGKRLKPYRDSAGVMTIGFGHNLNNRISDLAASVILDDDICIAVNGLDDNARWWRDIPPLAKLVLADMCFNLGWPRLSKFKKFLAAMQAQDWAKSIAEMRNSKWYGQVGHRAKNLERMLQELADE